MNIVTQSGVTQARIHAAPAPAADVELDVVHRLVRAVAQAGVLVDPVSIINVYVALKSKPLAILAGPSQTGKRTAVESLAGVLLQESWRCQTMLGHAWWANNSPNVATFTEAQTRFNTTKILALLQEAAQLENAGRVFVGCLAQISFAELVGFFSELAFQLQHERLMCLPSFHLNEPIPFPSNLLLVGTMDTGPFDWVDDDLYTKTTIIHWPSAGVSKPVDRCSPAGPVPGGERTFLQSFIRDERAAFQKLHQVPGWHSQLMNAFGRTRDLLADHGVALPDSATEEAIAYVANAWTRPGNGLFDRVTECNATIALDLALTQVVLVRTAGAIRASAPLRGQLAFLFQERFPRSWAFVNALQQS